eukprot:2730688-Rhodomonas_salina.1
MEQTSAAVLGRKQQRDRNGVERYHAASGCGVHPLLCGSVFCAEGSSALSLALPPRNLPLALGASLWPPAGICSLFA